MNNYGKLIEQNTLQFVRLLSASMEEVWEYLVDDEKRGLWFAAGPMDSHAGGKVEYRFKHDTLSPEKEVIPEKYKNTEEGVTSPADVLTYDKPHLLEIGWEGGVVTFQLEEMGDQVKLTLTHSNLPADKDQRLGTFAGWHTHLNVLDDRIDGKDPKGFWTEHGKMEKVYNRVVGESIVQK